MNNQLGAVPLSADILNKANIGLWAFELDEGQLPRMYVNEAMLALIGLKQQISPEETYHAWYDHIDEGSYELVVNAVEKMIAGEHAEVQYPWHNPNGHTIIVRCGGIRNFAYTAGIRIEGTHQDVTRILHLDEKELETMRQKERELMQSKLRTEALTYVSDHNPDADKFIDFIGHKIISVFQCDQVIFFNQKGEKAVFNTDGVATVPEYLCSHCPFERCRGNKKYGKEGAIVMNDCSLGYMGEAVHPDCPVKSSIIQQVYADDQLVGWLNVNYIKEYHTFSDDEAEIMKTISAYFGVLLERINHKREEEERAAKELAESASRRDWEIIEILASEYSSVYYIDLTTDGLNPYTMNEETETTFGSVFRSGITYSEAYRLYVNTLVYPEDKTMMLKAGSIENIKRELINKKTFLTAYRDANNKYSEMKFVKVGGDNDAPTAVALGFADKDEQIREEQEVKRYSEIANALSEKYDSIYYVNTEDDSYVHFHARDSYTSYLLEESGVHFFDECKTNLTIVAAPEDRKPVQDFIDKNNLLRALENGTAVLSQYRLTYADRSVYYTMRAVRPNPYEPHIIIAVENIDKEVRQREKEQAIRNQNFEIIKILASEYTSVYYIDLTTDGLTPYQMDEETETTFGSVFRSGITYSEAYRLYVNTLVYSEDKTMMLKAGSIANIKRELINKKTFLTAYRDANNKYSEMKFVKVGGDNAEPVAVALGFAEKDEQIRQQQAIEQERQMNFDIIEILASEYSSVYYIDLTTDGLNPYTMNEETAKTFGSVFRGGITYSEAYKLYVDKLVYPEDKGRMLTAGSISNIKQELAHKKTFLTVYRDADNKYSEMKFVKVGGDNDEPIAVALGFAEKDEQIRQERAIEQERQMNFDIIEILASEYTSVYYIDLTTDGLNPYTMNENTEMTFGSVFRSGITYSEAFRLYVGKLVFPEDKAMMLKSGAIGNIMKELRTKKTFLTTYRNAEGHYCEMKFVKVGNDEKVPTAVALGFADKDEELRSKREEEQILRRNIEIIEILASEYSSVYYIDMTTDELDPYTMNEQTESQFGTIFRSGIRYSEAFKLYVDKLVYPEDKAKMLKAGSVYNILNELSNKKTFLTQYRSVDGDYCEMKFVKVGDEENPQSVALGFSNKNDEIRANIEQQQKQERDRAVISGLSDDFGCVVYTDYEDFNETHYRFDPIFEKHIPDWTKINDFKERLEKLNEILVHPEDKEAFWAATRPEVVHAAVDKEGVYFVNFRILIDDKEIYYQAKFARDEIHPETNVIAGFHNIDAETKREMEALEQAKLANKAKTDFLFNMSHDIRTPMNAIIGFTNMAMKHIDDTSRVLDSLSKTKEAGELLLSLINDILDMSRVESGKISLNENEGDVYQSFANVESTMQELARAKNIALSFTVENIQNQYVYCDISRCMRVFVNIITNAIKYTREGGYVQVRCEQVGHQEECGLYRFTFTDNGIGMSEEFQKRVFDEFARENTATVSGIQGTGLGLSVCKSFVNAMKGTIEVKSKQEVGTTFTVTLPFKIREVEINPDFLDSQMLAAEEEDIDLSGVKVLLVDDNEMNREIAECILSEEGMEVETANDGADAVAVCREKGAAYYDFILMDIQMPIMDGYEATRYIREMYPEAHIPIIALSANAFAEDRAASLLAGMDDHVAKPIDVSELKRVMATHYTQVN